MEQFNLEEFLKDKNRKVVTRDGKPVRIICWNKLGYYPIVGCIRYSDDREEIKTYNIDGSKYSLNEEDPNDLFFADKEDELTEFEEAIYIYICTIVTACDGTVYGNKELKPIVKEIAKELIELARNEILKSLPKWKRSNSFFNTGNKFELGKTSLRRFDGYEIPYSELEKLIKEE